MDGVYIMKKAHASAQFTLIVPIFVVWSQIYSSHCMALPRRNSTRWHAALSLVDLIKSLKLKNTSPVSIEVPIVNIHLQQYRRLSSFLDFDALSNFSLRSWIMISFIMQPSFLSLSPLDPSTKILWSFLSSSGPAVYAHAHNLTFLAQLVVSRDLSSGTLPSQVTPKKHQIISGSFAAQIVQVLVTPIILEIKQSLSEEMC